MLARLQYWAIAALAVLAAMAGAYRTGARKQKEAEQAKIHARTARVTEVSNEVERDIRSLSDSDAEQRLRSKWQRD